MYTDIRSVIKGNIEAIDQGLRLVSALSDAQYQYIATPYVKSSVGQHFRHVVDMFFALINAKVLDCVDYDVRRRGASVESERLVAIAELERIRVWMLGCLDPAVLRSLAKIDSIAVQTEVTLEDTHSVVLSSNLVRELVFTSSHAVHHYALISVIAKFQGVELEENLGIAPATATFLRDEAHSLDAPSADRQGEACAQ
ncbi:MAG: hypothetical protein ACI9Y1_001327 [Lentisphaeria bacterium]|jgi:hypothetical protein